MNEALYHLRAKHLFQRLGFKDALAPEFERRAIGMAELFFVVIGEFTEMLRISS